MDSELSFTTPFPCFLHVEGWHLLCPASEAVGVSSSDAAPMAPAWPCSVFQLGLPPPSAPQHPAGRSGEHSVVCSRLSGSAEPQMWAEWAAAWRARAGETATGDPALQFGAGGGGWRRAAAESRKHPLDNQGTPPVCRPLWLPASAVLPTTHPALASASF